MFDIPAMRKTLSETYDLAPNPRLASDMSDLYSQMDRVVTPADWAIHAPYVAEINRLKKEKNAVILAHNYMTPDIYHGVADVVGDSLQLAIKATEVEADVIVQCGVHFMAETSKILNPSKTVLIPDMEAGCSLAESITAEGIEEMRRRYPGAPVVSYVNTTAEVKAASDICCTSSNAAQIVGAMDSDTVIMTPDQYLAQNVARDVPHKNVVWWEGSCIVHEQYTAKDIQEFREWNPGTRIIAHPECSSAFQRPKVGNIFDDANQAVIPARRLTDRTGLQRVIVSAHPTLLDLIRRVRKRFGHWSQQGILTFQEIERRSAR